MSQSIPYDIDAEHIDPDDVEDHDDPYECGSSAASFARMCSDANTPEELRNAIEQYRRDPASADSDRAEFDRDESYNDSGRILSRRGYIRALRAALADIE